MDDEIRYWIQGDESERGPLTYHDLELAAKFGTLTKTDRIRLSTGPTLRADQIGQFDYLPERPRPKPTFLRRYSGDEWKMSEIGMTRLMFEYLITCWAVLFIGLNLLPLFILPFAFFLGLRALVLGARTAWLPMLISSVTWIVLLIQFARAAYDRVSQGLV